MKRFLTLLTVMTLLLTALPFAMAEDPECWITHDSWVTITLKNGVNAWSQPSCTIGDERFVAWLLELLTVSAPCEPPEVSAPDSIYEVAFVGEGTFTVWHDSLYELSCVTRPDGTVHTLSPDVPNMLYSSLFDPISFDIPEEHRTLLADAGWTIAFRHPHMMERLPATLSASRTDPAALHFVWADLFLQDAGYDVTPYLGQAVMPYVYTLLEGVPRSRFTGKAGDTYRCSLFAVVLETLDGQVIGAYLKAYAWEGSWLLSLNGNGAPALLENMSARDYLLAHLPATEEETALATLTPEEIISRYGAINDPQLMEITVILDHLGTAGSALYDPLALAPRPTGSTASSVRKRDYTYRGAEGYEVRLGENLYFPYLVYESPETGWKIVSFYNTGY